MRAYLAAGKALIGVGSASLCRAVHRFLILTPKMVGEHHLSGKSVFAENDFGLTLLRLGFP
jgi:hypothetical protein